MNGRERVRAAYEFRPPDKTPVQFYYAPVGFYEHGEKLNDLFARYEGDFEPFAWQPIPRPPAEAFDARGRYDETRRDAWGTLWRYKIFGVWGMEVDYPLRDYARLAEYEFPPLPAYVTDASAFALEQEKIKEHRRGYFCSRSVGGFFEKLISLRPFEDVLCDMAEENEDFIALLDRLTEYYRRHIDALIRLGVDAISFGDDYGTQRGLIFSREMFQKYFMPRYRELTRPARAAGVKVHFHSCGKVGPLLEDFRAMGVDSIWPQLPAYDMRWLADCCRDLGLAVAIHTDRAETMTRGAPEQVRALVRREYKIFRPDLGGSWFYVEVDNGFPFESIRALAEEIYALRH